jgi:SapC
MQQHASPKHAPPRHALLNNIDHRDLRVVATRGAAWGDAEMAALTFPAEFRSVQAYYPIVFQKTADGGFQPVALFGFRQGQNLFLAGESWDAGYVPLAVERQPFLIGLSADGEPMLHIDLAHPRVSLEQGEALFRTHGGTTDFLDRATSTLQALHEGTRATPAFIDALLRHELLESFVLDIELEDGEQHRLAGFYTLHEERLAKLDGDTLGQLQRDGHLQPIYMAIASLSHFRDLIERARRADVDA